MKGHFRGFQECSRAVTMGSRAFRGLKSILGNFVRVPGSSRVVPENCMGVSGSIIGFQVPQAVSAL